MARGKLLFAGKTVLIKAASRDPLALRDIFFIFESNQRVYHFVNGIRRADQIADFKRVAVIDDVHMRIDESGCYKSAIKIYHLIIVFLLI